MQLSCLDRNGGPLRSLGDRIILRQSGQIHKHPAPELEPRQGGRVWSGLNVLRNEKDEGQNSVGLQVFALYNSDKFLYNSDISTWNRQNQCLTVLFR